VPHSRVLVADDDPDIRELVRELLLRDGLDVIEASTGREAVRGVHAHNPALVVLDVAMPELDGWQALERIRDFSDVPVLMLTAHASELEKVRGLRAGADDYVTKPFGRQELLARVQALLRRAQAAGPAAAEVYDDGYLRIDSANATVEVLGQPVVLTPLELRLLQVLVRHRDQILAREQILDLVWGVDAASPGQVKLYVGYLRRKLEAVDEREDGVPIETVRGFGYRYRSPSASPPAA
jgi:DNA-binding response OmpR family regulator